MIAVVGGEASLARAEGLLSERRLVEALTCFDQAEREGAQPDRCAAGRWTSYMLLGEYDCAWLQSDAIRARGAPDPHRVWDGSPWAGSRVLVRSVHGFGDAVQMLRYAPHLRRQAARLTLQVDPRFVEVARCFPGVDEVVAWEVERPYDVQIEITELPYIFRSNLQTLPAIVPYLSLASLAEVKAIACGVWDRRTAPRVGLVWTGGGWDNSRSIDFALLLPLIEGGAELELWSLQSAADNSAWEHFHGEQQSAGHSAGQHSITALVAAIAHMDLVITIDSLAAHIAGALAVPVWVLLKERADWRWMIDRTDSPWYPSMRLFRQRREGEWASVIDEVASTLTTWSTQTDR